MDLIIESGITIGTGITIGPQPVPLTVSYDILTENNDPLLTEGGDFLVTETY